MPSSSQRTKELQEQIDAILKAMDAFDLTNSQAWSDLDALSTHTFLDGVEIDPDGIIIRGNEFRGPMSVYVLLKYGGKKDEGFETSDAFTGEFRGHFVKDGGPVIDEVTVDTTPFYEGEEREEEDE